MYLESCNDYRIYIIYSELSIPVIQSLYSVEIQVCNEAILFLKKLRSEESRLSKVGIQMRITVIFHILIYIFICLLSCRIKTESPSRGEYIL